MKTTIKYAYDLSIPIYLKYLQSNLQHYGVIISFLNGGDWWSNLRELYRGEYATNFFDSLEKSFEITENVLSRLDEIHVSISFVVIEPMVTSIIIDNFSQFNELMCFIEYRCDRLVSFQILV